MSGSTRIGALRADLDLETAAWEGSLRTARTSMTRAQREMERSLTAIQAQSARTATAFGSLGAAAGALRAAFAPLAAALSIGGIVGLTRNALNAAGGLGELAEQAGVSVEGLQILQFAAAQAGVSNSQLETGLQRLTRTLGEAGEGSRTAVEAFQRLGVSFRDGEGRLRASEDVLPEIADALARIPEPAARAAAAVAIFGRGGQALLPILSQGAAGLRQYEQQARSFGAVLSAELASRADATGDAFAVLNRQFAVLQQRFAAGVAPAILTGVEALQRALIGLNNAIDNPSLGNVLRVLGAGGTVAGGTVAGAVAGGSVGGPLGAIAGGTAGLLGGFAAAVPQLQAIQTEIQETYEEIGRLEAQLRRLQALDGLGIGTTQMRAATLAAEVERTERALQAAIERVGTLNVQAERTAATFERTGRAAEAIARAVKQASDITSGAAGGDTPGSGSSGTPAAVVARGGGGRQEPQLRQYIQSLQDAVRLAQAELAVVNQGNAAREVARALIEAETRARSDQQAGLRSSATLTAAERSQIEAAARARAEAADQEQRLIRLRADGERVTAQFATAQQRLNTELERLNELLEAGEINQDLYNRAAQALKDEISGVTAVAAQLEKALGNAFADAIAEGRSFGDVLRGLERDLLRIGTQMAFRGLVNGLFGGGDSGGSGGGMGGIFSGIARFAAGLFGGFRAAGGPVDPSRYYVVGENGPEIFRPQTAGVIDPDGSRMGGGIVLNATFVTPDANSFRASQEQITADMARRIQRAGRSL